MDLVLRKERGCVKVNMAGFKDFSKRQYMKPLVLKSGSARFYAPLRASSKRERLPAGKILKLPEAAIYLKKPHHFLALITIMQ